MSKSLQVLTPMYGGMLAFNYHQSITALGRMCSRIGIEFEETSIWNESLIPRGRNTLADRFLKTGQFTHACFIDADIGFDPRDILAMMEADRDIVGAACVKKTIRWARIQKAVRENQQYEFTAREMAKLGGDFVINGNGTRTLKIGELAEVPYLLGMGILMVRRDVFTRFMEAYPERRYECPEDPQQLPGPIHDFFRVGINQETNRYDSEDYWFCRDCRAIGCKIWLCPWMRTSHMGAYEFLGDPPAVAALAGAID